MEQAKLRVVALASDLANIDRCVRIFHSDVDSEVIPAKVTFGKSPAGLPKGAGTRTALDILRGTGGQPRTGRLRPTALGKAARLGAECPTMLAKTVRGNFSRHKNWLVEFDRSTYLGRWKLV
jgi:hypothetical protein